MVAGAMCFDLEGASAVLLAGPNCVDIRVSRFCGLGTAADIADPANCVVEVAILDWIGGLI